MGFFYYSGEESRENRMTKTKTTLENLNFF